MSCRPLLTWKRVSSDIPYCSRGSCGESRRRVKLKSSECTEQTPCCWSRIKLYIKSHKDTHKQNNILYPYRCVVMQTVWVWFGDVETSTQTQCRWVEFNCWLSQHPKITFDEHKKHISSQTSLRTVFIENYFWALWIILSESTKKYLMYTLSPTNSPHVPPLFLGV